MLIKSLRTVQHHDYWLARFFNWCDTRGIASIHDVTRPVLVRYQRWLFYFRKKNGKAMSFSAPLAPAWVELLGNLLQGPSIRP